jgi:hypothetical protein
MFNMVDNDLSRDEGQNGERGRIALASPRKRGRMPLIIIIHIE